MTASATVDEPGRYQLLPRLSDEEYFELRQDIEANGIRVPVDVDEDGNILDGHHRARIADALRIECPRRVLPGLDESEKRAHALAVNVHRRSLSRQQRRDLIAASIKADPQVTDREHARRVGVHNETVAAVRLDLVKSGEVTDSVTRIDPRGYQQPATKPARVTVDTDTGEVTAPPDMGRLLDAIEERVPGSRADLAAASQRARWSSCLARAGEILTMSPAAVAAVLSDSEVGLADVTARDLVTFMDKVKAERRPGLRSVGNRDE